MSLVHSDRLRKAASVLLLSVSLLYFEFLFHAAAIGSFSLSHMPSLILFPLVPGFLLGALRLLIRNRKARIIVTSVLLALLALPFLIEYFVYSQFKVFYDLNTVGAGAGDVITGGFFGQLIYIISRPISFLIIGLYFLPLILYLILTLTRKSDLKPSAISSFLLTLACGVGCFLLLALSPSLSDAYTREYSFSSCVSRFGLSTALRLEVAHLLRPDSGLDFEDITVEESSEESRSSTEQESSQQETSSEESSVQEEASEETSIPEESSEETVAPEESSEEPIEEPEPEPTPVVYEPNVLDIDFNALADSTSGTLADLDRYVAAQTPSLKNEYTGLFEGKNLIFISAEAFSGDIIDKKLTPTLYRLANRGIQFTDYYQPASAGTTGGEYENLFGMLPTSGGSSFKMTASHYNYMTMGSQLDRLGYFGWAFHNNAVTYYDRDKTHTKLGYSEGYMAYGNGMEAYVTDEWPQSDLEMMEGTVPLYIGHQPFNIYYMSVSGHNPYTNNPSANAMSAKNWDEVKDLPYSNTVKAYIAANLELEHALTYLVTTLEKAGIADDTVIVLSADHFPYGLDDDGTLGNMPYLEELYGFTPRNYLERDHNRLILWCGCLEEMDPIVVDTPVSSLDILPTLSNLFGTEFDSRLFPGRDVFSDAQPLVFTINYDWKTDLGTFTAGNGAFTPVSEDIEIPEGYVDRMKAIVRNKVNYCRGALDTDYFRHVFERDESDSGS